MNAALSTLLLFNCLVTEMKHQRGVATTGDYIVGCLSLISLMLLVVVEVIS